MHSLGKHNEQYYLVFERFDGCTLDNAITGANGQLNPMSLERAMQIFNVLCETLQQLHDAGQLHGLLDTATVLLDGTGSGALVRLLDATVVGLFEDAKRPNMGVQVEMRVDAYSPEKLMGKTYDARADIFSLGCILYKMLTAHSPFSGRLRSSTQQRSSANRRHHSRNGA